MKPHFHNQSDDELLKHFYFKGELDYLGALLERYTILLLGLCLKYLKNEEEAKDMVQHVFLKVLTVAPSIKINNFGAWIYQVTRNECLSQLRKTKGSPQIGELLEEITEGIQNEGSKPSEKVREEILFEQLEIALESLNEEQASCIRLFYYEGKSYSEIANQLQMETNKVKSHIQNGKRNLKIKLAPVVQQTKEGGDYA